MRHQSETALVEAIETIKKAVTTGKRTEAIEVTKEALASAVEAGMMMKDALITQKFADEIGADFYGEDAHQCVEVRNRLLS